MRRPRWLAVSPRLRRAAPVLLVLSGALFHFNCLDGLLPLSLFPLALFLPFLLSWDHHLRGTDHLTVAAATLRPGFALLPWIEQAAPIAATRSRAAVDHRVAGRPAHCAVRRGTEIATLEGGRGEER